MNGCQVPQKCSHLNVSEACGTLGAGIKSWTAPMKLNGSQGATRLNAMVPFALARAAVAQAKREIDEADIEAEEAADRPRAKRHEKRADSDADPRQHQHQHVEPTRRQAAIG